MRKFKDFLLSFGALALCICVKTVNANPPKDATKTESESSSHIVESVSSSSSQAHRSLVSPTFEQALEVAKREGVEEPSRMTFATNYRLIHNILEENNQTGDEADYYAIGYAKAAMLLELNLEKIREDELLQSEEWLRNYATVYRQIRITFNKEPDDKLASLCACTFANKLKEKEDAKWSANYSIYYGIAIVKLKKTERQASVYAKIIADKKVEFAKALADMRANGLDAEKIKEKDELNTKEAIKTATETLERERVEIFRRRVTNTCNCCCGFFSLLSSFSLAWRIVRSIIALVL